MKKYKIDWKLSLTVLSAAILGSLMTLGISQSVQKESVFRVEHHNAFPTAPSRYVQPGEDVPNDFSQTAELVMPGVVHIKSTLMRSSRGQRAPQIPDAFRDFFGDQFGERFEQRGPQPRVGSGSGVILSADGYIVTNNHVIDQADDIEVSLNDNRSFKAEVVGTDPSTDLALLKIEADELTPVVMGNSDDVRVGEWVLAIGNPFNLNSTVTAGIVSAKTRNINILRDQAAIESFIQTDAAVNPGNSGGALVNLRGELIGINTAIASPTGSYSGYSFAVPTSLVRKVVEDLMQHGVVQRAYLGVMIRNLDGNFAAEKGLKLTEGVYVDSLLGNSAALEAGLKAGDVITAVDGVPVNNASALQAAIGTHRPGDQVSLSLDRNGSQKTIKVTLRNRDGNTQIVERSRPTGSLAVLGAELETINESLAKRLEISGGVQVKSLRNGGKLSRETDMREGFVITHVNGKQVSSIEELEKHLSGKSGGVMLEGLYTDYPGKYYYAFGM